jgi:hypothetical protein
VVDLVGARNGVAVGSTSGFGGFDTRTGGFLDAAGLHGR